MLNEEENRKIMQDHFASQDICFIKAKAEDKTNREEAEAMIINELLL